VLVFFFRLMMIGSFLGSELEGVKGVRDKIRYKFWIPSSPLSYSSLRFLRSLSWGLVSGGGLESWVLVVSWDFLLLPSLRGFVRAKSCRALGFLLQFSLARQINGCL
jgi:hypothetical protein